jgi:thioredoxin reductase
LRIARAQLQPYKTVELRELEVREAKRTEGGFVVNTNIFCSKLLLATGVVDRLPQIDGLREFYGHSAFHCPYCDGWEVRDRKIVVYGRGKNGYGLALELTLWSSDLALCTDGPTELSNEETARLKRQRIEIYDTPIRRLIGSQGMLEQIEFTNGELLECDAMFFSTSNEQHSNLAESLGCEFNEDGAVDTGEYEITNVPGVYVAGDASKLVQLAIVAAAEGAKAAFAINQELLKEDLV